MTKKDVIEQALTRVLQAQEHRTAVHAAVHFVRQGGYPCDVPHELEAELLRLEAEAWSTLTLWGLVADTDTQDRIKTAAHEHYLSDRKSVAGYLDPGNAGAWLHSDETAFREMARKAFAPRDKL
jgi:hypothetical protein